MDTLIRERAETVLSTLGWLSREPEAFRTELFRWAVVQRFQAGTVIYRLTDPPGGVYGLVSGALAVSLPAESEASRLLQYGSIGGWIGVVPFLTGGVRRAEIRAASDCVVMHLPLAAMEAICERDPMAARAFARILLANLDTALELLRILLLPDAGSRIAAGLLRAARSQANPVPISQAELAAMTNTSPRQASTTLRRFETDGLITCGYRQIEIVDSEGLRARINEKID